MIRKSLLAALFLLCIGSPAWALNCSSNPFTLTEGTTALATQVMANFNNLLTCANTVLGKFTGPASSVDNDVVCFNGTTGQSGKACASGIWPTYTPAIICSSGGPALTTASISGEYLRLGRFIAFNVNVFITTNGTCGTAWTVTLPVTPTTSGFAFSVNGRSTTKGTLSCGIAGGVVFCQAFDLSYFAVDGTSVAITGFYEADTN